MKHSWMVVTVLGLSVAPAFAQERVMFMTPDTQSMAPLRASTVVESRITTGRPYSAEATTEFVQVLGDGNKIARRSTVRIYRDSEGRTRREELASDGTVKSISIYDPVAHVSYVLDPSTRTARRSPIRMVYPSKEMADKVGAEREAAARVAGKIAVAPVPLPAQAATEDLRKRQTELVVRAAGAGALQPAMRVQRDASEESLGQKAIDGVLADGKRVTTVLPAGAIGNQQAITVASEQWFSPDLEILLMTRHSDPRTGETSYTLSNITRGEPAAGLFDVPADYTVQESLIRTPAAR
jgi:hypothetical protein